VDRAFAQSLISSSMATILTPHALQNKRGSKDGYKRSISKIVHTIRTDIIICDSFSIDSAASKK
jgi:hypothetical protein